MIKVEGILPRVDSIKDLNSITEIREFLNKTRSPNYDLINDPDDYSQMGVALFYPNSSDEIEAGFNVNIDKFKEIRLSNSLFHKLEIILVLDQEDGFFNEKIRR